ncbi:TPR repeat region-containing protein [Nocardiopsis sp. NPDC055551]
MAGFDLTFKPVEIDGEAFSIRSVASDLEILTSRILGRAGDLNGSLNDSATQFSDVIGWNIKYISEEDYALWQDAANAVTYCSHMTDMWASAVGDYNSGKNNLIREWNREVNEKKRNVPDKYQGTVITATYPERGIALLDWQENKCRDLYLELTNLQSELQGRASDLLQEYRDSADDIRKMLEQGATEENVQKLIDGGHTSWAFFNISPEKYTMLLDEEDLSEERARELPDQLNPYWTGEKPIDDEYHELMLVLSMVSTKAMQAQQDGTDVDEELEFLIAFNEALENSHHGGIIDIPDIMKEGSINENDMEHALGVIGDGLLVQSDHRIGGGYNDLPESIRRTAEGTYFLPDGENYSYDDWAADFSNLSDLLEHTSEGIEGGFGFSATLNLTTGMHADAFPADSHMSDLLTSDDLEAILDASTRNRDANHAVLTGDFDHPNLIDSDGNYLNVERQEDENGDLETQEEANERARQSVIDNALGGILAFDWSDNGRAAAGLTDWIHEDKLSEDPDVQQRAGEAAVGFIETITSPEMHETLSRTEVAFTDENGGEFHNPSFTMYNDYIADSLMKIYESYIDSFSGEEGFSGETIDLNYERVPAEESWDSDNNTFTTGIAERTIFLEYIMGNSDSAAEAIAATEVYRAIQMETLLETGEHHYTGGNAGRLNALVNQSIMNEALERGLGEDEINERKRELYGAAAATLTNPVGSIPRVGFILQNGVEYLTNEMIENALSRAIDTIPRGGTETANYTDMRSHAYVLSGELDSNGGAFPETDKLVRGKNASEVLEESGVLVESEGRYRIELDDSRWNEGYSQDSILEALEFVNEELHVDTIQGDYPAGSSLANKFTESFRNPYEDLSSELDRYRTSKENLENFYNREPLELN